MRQRNLARANRGGSTRPGPPPPGTTGDSGNNNNNNNPIAGNSVLIPTTAASNSQNPPIGLSSQNFVGSSTFLSQTNRSLSSTMASGTGGGNLAAVVGNNSVVAPCFGREMSTGGMGMTSMALNNHFGQSDANRDVCFTQYNGSPSISGTTEGNYIKKALIELPELVNAFFLARKEYCKGATPHLMDKLNLRIAFIDTVVRDILSNEDLVECLEPNHVIAPFCPAFAATWERVGKYEEDQDLHLGSKGPSSQLSTVATQISAVAPRLEIDDSSSIKWSLSATGWSAVAIASIIFLVLAALGEVACGTLALVGILDTSKFPSWAIYTQISLGGVALIATITLLMCHRETLLIVDKMKGRYDEILGVAERYTRAATNLATGQERKVMNPLAMDETTFFASPDLSLAQHPSSPNPGSRQPSITAMSPNTMLVPPPSMTAPAGSTAVRGADGSIRSHGGSGGSQTTGLGVPSTPGGVMSPGISNLLPILPPTSGMKTGANSSVVSPLIPNINNETGSGAASTPLDLTKRGGDHTNSGVASPSRGLNSSGANGGPGGSGSGGSSGMMGGLEENIFILPDNTFFVADALQEELLLISLNHNLEVTAFNAQATIVTDFDEEEMRGISISTIVDDSSYDVICEMQDLVNRGLKTGEPRRIEFFGKQGSTEIKVILAPLCRTHDKRNTGCVLIGFRDVAPAKTNNVMLLRYYLDQLGVNMVDLSKRIAEQERNAHSAAARAIEASPSSGDLSPKSSSLKVLNAAEEIHLDSTCLKLLNRSFQYLDLVDWDKVCSVARCMLDWQTIRVEKLLQPTVRNFIANMDLEMAHPLPDIVECDVEAVNELLNLILGNSKGRALVVVSVGNYKAEVCAMLRISVKSVEINKKAVRAEPAFDSYCSRSGACISYEANGDANLDIPLQPSAALQAHMSASSVEDGVLAAGSPKQGAGGAGPQIMFLLYETHNIYRHSVSTSIWNIGHPLCLIDSADEARNTPRSNLQTIALLDYNGPHFIKICNELIQVPEIEIIVAMDSKSFEQNGGVASSSFKMLGRELTKVKKPIRKRTLTRLVEENQQRTASQQADLRAQQSGTQSSTPQPALQEPGSGSEEPEKQKGGGNVFAVHHSAPWKRGELLGKGSFGDVYVADNILTGGKMAVKMIPFDMEGIQEQTPVLINEVDIMCSVSHPHIVHYFYCEKGATTLNLFMELCTDGSLGNYLTNTEGIGKAGANNKKQSSSSRKPRTMGNQEAAWALRQILEAVSYLHSIGIVHRDIKPDNVLLNEGKLKIADFGTAAKIGPQKLSDTSGTMKYMAPEIWEGIDYAYPCDIWSIGIMTLEMLGKQPYWLRNCTNFSLNSYYFTLGSEKNPDLPADLTGDALDFVRCCLQTKQVNRPTAMTLLNFPFIVDNTGGSATPAFKRSGVATSNDGALIRRNSLKPRVDGITPINKDLPQSSLNVVGGGGPGSPRSSAAHFAMNKSGSDNHMIPGLPGGVKSREGSRGSLSMHKNSMRSGVSGGSGGDDSDDDDLIGLGPGGGMPPGMGAPPGVGGGGPSTKPAAGGGGGMPPGMAPPGFGGGGGMPPGVLPPGVAPPSGGGGMPPGALPPGVAPPGAKGGAGMPPGMMPPGVAPPMPSNSSPTKSAKQQPQKSETGDGQDKMLHDFDKSQDIGKMMKDLAAEQAAKEKAEEEELEKDEEAEIKKMIKEAQRGGPAQMDDDDNDADSFGSDDSDLIMMEAPLM